MVDWYKKAVERTRRYVYVVYPRYKRVSFSFVGENHYQQLQRFFRTYAIDESALPVSEIVSHPLIYLHPYFYVMDREGERLKRRRAYFKGIIGVDVADGDHVTSRAAELANMATAMVVPSNFCRRAYVNSGVKVPVHVVPHGVTEEWIGSPPQRPCPLTYVEKIKEERKAKVLLAFIIHSPFRKGLDILIEVYKGIVKERGNAVLTVKTMRGLGVIPSTVQKVGETLEESMQPPVVEKWFTEREKMSIYDAADLFLLTSRGGGFEHSGLEALARGVPVIAARGGAWEDYLPSWCLTPSKRSPPVLEGNPIHDGCGVEMLIDKAVDKALTILDNLEEYKAKAKEYADTRLKKEFTWSRIGEALREVTLKYL
ncbi:MAG: glycosyltransferase [Candidatus Bathyarchaeia archaeon]